RPGHCVKLSGMSTLIAKPPLSVFLTLAAALAATSALAGPKGFNLESHSAKKYGMSLPERVDKLSSIFLGSDYVGDPLGEGESGVYDRDPLYRFDAFDCTTYVETVLALSR